MSTQQSIGSKSGWLTVMGSPAPELEASVAASVADKIVQKKFKQADVDYLKRIDRSAVSGALNVSDENLEKLRRLCQLWEIELKVGEISSHRKFIGPFIVGFKKILFPILRVLMKDLLRQQRDFNAASIALLADLARKDR